MELDRMTQRLSGSGLRPAMVLTTCFVGPPAYAMAAISATRLDGFPTLTVTMLILLAALLGAVLTSDTAAPDLMEVLRRAAILAFVAIAVGLFTPSLTESISDLSERWNAILGAPFLPVWVLLLVAHGVGHGVAARVAMFVDGRRTRQTDRLREENIFMMWLVAATLTVVAIGLAGGAVGLLAGGLAVVAMLASGLTIAHLRAATPHAGGRRPAIVVTSQRARRVAVTGAVTLVALVALLGVAFLPPTITEASPRLVSWLSEFAFDAETPSPWFPPDEEGEQVSEGGDEGGTLEEPVMRDRVSGEGDIPVWPLPVILAALLLWLIIYLVRAGRWREVWAAILEWLRAGGDRRRRDDEFDALEALERVETARSSWSDRFDRFRPRPRDPRGAILHDYLRAERALARHELGRDGWETLFEHADRSGLGKQHRELARLASDARYGRPEPSESDSVRSRELSRSLIRAIKDRRPAEQPAGG